MHPASHRLNGAIPRPIHYGPKATRPTEAIRLLRKRLGERQIRKMYFSPACGLPKPIRQCSRSATPFNQAQLHGRFENSQMNRAAFSAAPPVSAAFLIRIQNFPLTHDAVYRNKVEKLTPPK